MAPPRRGGRVSCQEEGRELRQRAERCAPVTQERSRALIAIHPPGISVFWCCLERGRCALETGHAEMRTGLRAFATAKIVCKIEDRTLAESGNVSTTQYMYVDFAVAQKRHEINKKLPCRVSYIPTVFACLRNAR